MPRPQRCRRICKEPAFAAFSPEGLAESDTVVLSLDEFEVIRLVDLEKQTHEQCAARMDISRTTVTEIYESAREKIADCIVNGRHLVISGGNYRFCDGSAAKYCGKRCEKRRNCNHQENASENPECRGRRCGRHDQEYGRQKPDSLE